MESAELSTDQVRDRLFSHRLNPVGSSPLVYPAPVESAVLIKRPAADAKRGTRS